MNPALNLILIGPMGAGKTTIGRRLAERFGLRFVDLDECIQSHTGVSVSTIFEVEGEAGFRRREEQALATLCADQDLLIATGGGAVLSAANRQLMHERGFVVWLRTPVERQIERLAHDRSRPLLQGANRHQRLMQMAAQRDPLYAATCDLLFESERRKAGAAAARLGQIIEHRWQRSSSAA